MATEISYNGSRLAGEAPATLDELLDVMRTEPLDRTFSPFAANIAGRHGFVCYFGNFLHVSHAFHIVTDDPADCARLTEAIKANTRRPSYHGQPAPKRLRR